jgi:chaperone modulatory protein CbpM
MRNNLIAVSDICTYHHMEIDLIKTTIQKQSSFLSLDELSKLERYVRLAKDLDINLEGLHAIAHLLNQVENMQQEINTLKADLIHSKHFN